MDNNTEILLKTIQHEIKRCLANIPHVVYKYPAQVTALDKPNDKIEVKLAGFKTLYTFYNKTGISLAVGDYVFVEAVGNNLTNGFISERFGR